jgi:outer membrane lipoprotein SlyB
MYDWREAVAVLGFVTAEIASPKQVAVMVEAEEVVGCLGGPVHIKVFGVHAGSGRGETVELVVGVFD